MSSNPSSWPLLALAVIGSIGCHAEVRRFPLTPPMWDDHEDRRAFAAPPDDYFSPFLWDGADQMVFRPLARLFAVDVEDEAINVNAMDEVPDSSWYVNRLSRYRLSTERLVRAACTEPPLDPDQGPWKIIAAKPNGANPGFIIEDAEGRKFLLKFDSPQQKERATAADVIGSMLYWGAGYHTPCNRIVFFSRDILEIPEGAKAEIGTRKLDMTWDLLEPAFQKGFRLPDGRFRAASSRFLPGRPLGPWRYEGTRDEDPNDVIAHEERRELRGAYVISSWINHFDTREQNTLSAWIDVDGEQGYVRHYFIDFGDSFGSLWSIEAISRRLGHSAYFDFPHVAADFVSLGLIPRPWNRARFGPSGVELGYYDVERFEADSWRPGYPNPAFLQATERDMAWMARIIARFRPADIQAIIEEAQIDSDLVRTELHRIMMGRRSRILRRWFRRVSPLTFPEVRTTRGSPFLCLEDLALSAGLVEPEDRPYLAQAWIHEEGGAVIALDRGPLVRSGTRHICVGLPDVPGVQPGAPAYLIVDVTGLYALDDDESMPARVHLYQLGPGRYAVAGLERPYDRQAPGGG